MEFDLAGIAVMIAMPVFDNMPPATVRSLLETQAACAKQGVALDIEMNVGSTVFHARSLAAHRFLKGDCTKIFMIDSDMVWAPADFMRLLALSSKLQCVSATYPTRSDPPRFYIGVDEGPLTANEYGCVPVNGVGLGFTVVSREVVQRLADLAPKITFYVLPGESVAKIFRFDEPDGEARGEDMAFFSDIKKLGVQPWLDPKVELGHIGAKEYRARFSDHLVKV